MNTDIKHFIVDYVKEIQENNAAVFIGAGLSTSAGYVNWKQLIEPLAQRLDLDIEKEHDMIAIAQYYRNSNTRQSLSQHLFKNISTIRKPTPNHELLAKLPIRTFWTTNYDKLIEKAFESVDKILDVKYTVPHLTLTRDRRDAVLYKMHGDSSHPNSAIIDKDDYESYSTKFSPFIDALSGDLVSKTFLFLGFSFSDPNFNYIISRIRINLDKDKRLHYCIVKQVSASEFKSEEAFSHASNMQKLMIDDLRRYGIKTLLIENYSDIDVILKSIYKVYFRHFVFFSGSASDFSLWDSSLVSNFLDNLGSSLIQNNYRIITGVGLGVGSSLIGGALRAIYEINYNRIGELLQMYPFPQNLPDPSLKDKIWADYRSSMIKNAGIAIFFMGNKVSEMSKIVLADGVRKEFEIAKEKNLILIPIGCSGHMAKQLWNEVYDDFQNIYGELSTGLLPLFMQLNENVGDPSELIPVIIKMLNLIKEHRYGA